MNKEVKSYRLLVVEDNPGDFVLLKSYLKRTDLIIEKIEHAVDMTAVAEIIKNNVFDIAFLDLTLPDSTGVDSVVALNLFLPQTPIIILSGLSTIEIAIQAIAQGAQDYLIKGDFDEKLLTKSIQYSIERKKTIRHLQESNERFEFVNKATQDTIWEWDYGTNKGKWGEGLIETYGYTVQDLFYDESWIDQFVHPADRKKVLAGIVKNINSKKRNWHSEFRFRCADGSYKEVYDRGYILYDANGELNKMIGAMTDLTEKRQLRRELIQQQLQQQKLITETTVLAQEKERNELGKELHDNINQILATVKMYLGMAKSGAKTSENLVEKSYEYVNDAMEEIRKLSHSLVAPSLGDIGLATALEELVDTARITGMGEVVLQVNDLHPEDVSIDKTRQLVVYRIVQEQMNNINKYAAATKVTVSLKKKKDVLLLSISDNGKGFNPSEKITGIGLKNIKSRVEFYEGNMEVISAPGRGCTLNVFIPLVNN